MYRITLDPIPADGLASNDWVANAFLESDETVSIASASGNDLAEILSIIGETLSHLNRNEN